MRNLIAFLIKNSYWFLFIALEIACFFFIFQYNSYQRSIFFNSSNELAGRVYSISGSVQSFFNLHKNNEALLEENAMLQQRILSLEGYINNIIPDTISPKAFAPDIEHTINYDYRVARIVNNSISLADNYIIINKGSNDGIEAEMGVISHNGIVGFVRSASPNYAIVQSVLNTKTQLSCKVKRSNMPATLVWNVKDYRYATLKDFPKYEKFEEGDTIVTSGLSKFFPEGFIVGTIKEAKKQKDDNFYNLDIVLATDFATLDNVLIINNYKQKEEITGLMREVRHE